MSDAFAATIIIAAMFALLYVLNKWGWIMDYNYTDKLLCHIVALLDVAIIELGEVEPHNGISLADIQRDIMILKQIQDKYNPDK